MTDREKILSNDYYDLITDYVLPLQVRESAGDYVYQPISGEIGVTYINRADVMMPMSVSNFTHSVIPKVFGLMQTGLYQTSLVQTQQMDTFDPTALLRSGITQVQGDALNLTGRGVVIGFLDTGERVIILSRYILYLCKVIVL